jgi:glycosyltransferase involved in cell wall biosynthesis
MIKVTALTASKIDPSSRFRIRQFIRPLRNLGVDVGEHWSLINRYRIEPLPLLAMALRLPGLLASKFSDVTWLGRELVSGRYSLEGLAGKKRVFDVDDAIWLPYKSDFSAEIVQHCDGVIAGNQFLADHYQRLGAKVWLVPTAVDTDEWRPPIQQVNQDWTIGWIASWANLEFLYEIEEPLAQFLEDHPGSRLLIVCTRKPAFKKLSDKKWEFVQWSAENEVARVQQMDVGLMPLRDDNWSRHKCGLKALEYMAVGLPIVISPVGVNAEILNRDEVGFAATSGNDWYAALERLFTESELGPRMGAAGRRVVQEHYSVTANAPKLANIFREVAAGS